MAIHAHGAVWSDNSTGFIATSDRRIKKNIVDCSDALSTLNQLQVKNYEYIAGNGNGNEGLSQPPTVGFIAQEVKEHLPNLVTGTDGQKDMTVDYNGILAHAVKAITELSAEVEILKTKVAALEAA